MIKKRVDRIGNPEKLNVVPITDAIFIFIFFLLFSAQFIKLFEIETEAPIVREVPDNVEMEKEPLNLTVKIFSEKVEISTGVTKKKTKVFLKSSPNLTKSIKSYLLSLRKKRPDVDHVIISPHSSIEYNEIIKIIDIVQTIPQGQVLKIMKEKKEKVLKKIFTQLVLEPMDES